MKLRDKVVVVTGAGNGIGRELARGLVLRGARIAAVDVSAEGLAKTHALVRERGGEMSSHVLDITRRDEVGALPDAVLARFGAVDGLINCAGIIQPFVSILELEYEVIDRVFAVNWHGTLHLTKAFLPHLLGRPESHLVNVSSMGAFLPVPGQTAYGASKAAVKLLTEGLRSELAGTSVGVTLVLPGAIGTAITTNSGVANPADSERLRRLTCPPDRAARRILDAIERNRARITIGVDAWSLDVMTRVSPVAMPGLLAGPMKRLLVK